MSLISPLRSGGVAGTLGRGYTGAPSDYGACIACHATGGFGLTTQEFRLIDTVTSLEVNAYQPGKLYDVEIDVIKGRQTAFPQAYGFQAVALGPDTLSIGTWTNLSSNVQLEDAEDARGNMQTYIEHGSPSFSSSFKMQWRAPWSSTDTVKFYYAGNAVNLNGNQSGDNGGMGAMLVLPPMGMSHLELTTGPVLSGDYHAVDSISLSADVSNGASINLHTQRAVRLLPTTSVPANSSLQISLSPPN